MRYLLPLLIFLITGCSPEPPLLSVTQTFIDFGEESSKQIMVIGNSGQDVLEWSAEWDRDWIFLENNSGRINKDDFEEILITVDRTGLEKGTYGGNISITSNGGNTDVLIRVIQPLTPEAQLKKIAKVWYLDVVTYKSSTAITDQWPGFELTIFSDLTYATENPRNPGPWTGSGSFDWAIIGGKKDPNHFIRDDGLEIQISASTPGKLTMLMFYYHDEHRGLGGAEGDGEYSFIFTDVK